MRKVVNNTQAPFEQSKSPTKGRRELRKHSKSFIPVLFQEYAEKVGWVGEVEKDQYEVKDIRNIE